MSTPRALPIAVQATRDLGGAGPGVVVVFLHAQQVVGSLHLRPGTEVADIAALAAEAVRADQAVLIVVADLRIAGHLILEADQAQKALAGVGVTVSASVHVSALEADQRWTDLSLVHPRDGFISRIVGRRPR